MTSELTINSWVIFFFLQVLNHWFIVTVIFLAIRKAVVMVLKSVFRLPSAPE